jgi:hypothetical protein
MPWELNLGNKYMKELVFGNVNDELFSLIPELEDQYREALGWWQGSTRPGPYTVFGFVVQPAVRALLRGGECPDTLKRVFCFFEEMSHSADIQVSNLLQIEIFEWLIGDPQSLAVAWKYMGDDSKRLARETAVIWRCEKNLPVG